MVPLRWPSPMDARSAPRSTATACAPPATLITDDDLVVMSSEIGVLPIPQERIVKKWRLQPGKMFLIDLEQGRIIDDAELKRTMSRAKPYRKWIEASRYFVDDLPEVKSGKLRADRC
jgi:glutamate synthase (NADPH/NADH) large chain